MTARAPELRDERGIALIIALLVLLVLSTAVAGLLQYSSSTQRTASYSKSQQLARSIAEAGINDAVAVLNLPANNALNPALLPTRTSTYEGGTATWSGTLNSQTATWTITSTATVRNPTGAAPIRKTMSVNVPVTPTFGQTLNNQAWNYIYSYRTATPGGCDMTIQQSVNMGSPLYVEGNLCMQNTATITGSPLVVKGKLTLTQTQNRVGSSSAPINEAHIGGGCQWKNNPTHSPCSSADNVFATTIDANPAAISPPTVDWDGWYNAASPGPKFPCDPSRSSSSSTWPIFENETVNPTRNKSVPTAFNLTPSTSYDCWTAGGEIAWNASTKVLTLNGTTFIDGSAYVSNGAVNEYNGQGSLYLSGTFFMQSSYLCALKLSNNTACDTTNWNPNSEAMIVVANGNGDNGIPVGDGVQIKSAYFQGGIYATNIIDIDTTANVDGPMVGSTVNLGQSVNTNFPFISFVPTGTPGNPVVYAQPLAPTGYSGG